MKKELPKERAPRPAAVAKQHEDTAPAKDDSSIADCRDSNPQARPPAAHPDVGDLSQRAVDDDDPGDLLSSVVSDIRQFLICDDNQLTILALWCLYTWCYDCFLTASYLDIHSPAPQSGKTRCLNILFDLCYCPDFIGGADSRTARRRLLHPGRTAEQIADGKMTGPYTFLFDDCHLALSTSERQPLLALLNSGTSMTIYTDFSTDYLVFGPKAFAGSATLPGSLTARCIPILLFRKKPSEKVDYFAPGMHQVGAQNDNSEDATQLPRSLQRWATDKNNREALEQTKGEAIPDLPAGLTPAQQDCAEPLLRIADRIGRRWPQKARAAIAALFHLAPSDPALQLLADIRNCFLIKNNPSRLSTSELLDYLINLDNRPWTTSNPAWNRNSGRRLGAVLKPFKISSSDFSFAPKKILKGYRRRDFHNTWERYLQPIPASPESFGRT